MPEQNYVTDSERKVHSTLTRDESLNFRAAHWADLHGLLYNALPSDIFLWGHVFLSFHVVDDKGCVIVKAKVLETGEVVEIEGDLLVAADGCLSSIRQKYLPDFKLRFVFQPSGIRLLLSIWKDKLYLYNEFNAQIYQGEKEIEK